MCGINGIMTTNDALKRKMPCMNNLLKHRGPDDEGFVLINPRNNEYMQFSGDDSVPEIKAKYPHISTARSENYDVVLAQRRLAIIDLTESGHARMSSTDGKIWITYNGEIYNYIELREELRSNGFVFKTESDTEVIINSYLHWGIECLNKFNGMWAFAIWDGYKNQLLLSRDRFGIKPLYYSHHQYHFAFSSEIKPLISLSGASPEIDKEKIPYFIIYGNRLNSCTTYIKNIYSLPASHYLVFKNNNPIILRYYDVRAGLNQFDTEEELKDKIVDTLSDSIKLRFRSDVPVGTCLSGGFDSSSIVSLSSSMKLNKLSTFSAVWDDKDCDESKYIDLVNTEYGCTPNKVTPKAEDFEKVFDKLNYFQEIPTEGPGLYPQWYVMQRAKGNVKVLLDGQGGDEVFGGYFLMGTYLRGILRDRKILGLFSEFNNFLQFLNKQGLHSFSS